MGFDWVSGFEQHAAKLLDEYLTPGSAVGLAKDGKIVYAKGLGTRDAEKTVAPDENTVYGIGSITKSFTCVAIMQLQEQGKLSVHDPVVKFLPDFRLPRGKSGDDVTIHHFMTHTSGLPPLPCLGYALKESIAADMDGRDEEEWAAIKDRPYVATYAQLIESIANCDVDLLGPVGQQFSYSNDGYALLGAIIDKVSGETYEDYVEKHVLQAAGMHHSYFEIDSYDDKATLASLFGRKEEEDGKEVVYSSPLWWRAPAMTAAGFLKSTVRDMVNYAEIYRNKGVVNGVRILSEESVKAMCHPYIECEPERSYGYGLMIKPDFHGGTLVDHGGSLKGIQAQMSIVPEHGLSAISLTNVQGGPATMLSFGLLQCALGEAPDEPVWAFKKNTENLVQLTGIEPSLEALVGKYVSGEGGTIEVTQTEDGLTFTAMGHANPSIRLSGDTFLMPRKADKMAIKFLMGEDGKARAMTFGFRMVPRQPEEEKAAEAEVASS